MKPDLNHVQPLLFLVVLFFFYSFFEGQFGVGPELLESCDCLLVAILFFKDFTYAVFVLHLLVMTIHNLFDGVDSFPLVSNPQVDFLIQPLLLVLVDFSYGLILFFYLLLCVEVRPHENVRGMDKPDSLVIILDKGTLHAEDLIVIQL